tara:strand:+ start:14519 stop:15415 length:897 start_codon:yes stop_codon:yes gene_type:complete
MFKELFLKLTERLYPKGRAFKIVSGSTKEKLHTALADSENDAYTSGLAVLDSILPDNPNFTAEDATDWERRLGMISNPFVILSDRKLAIARKMNHPGTIPARQHYKYIEGQLQAAGFDVIVTENRFPLSATIPTPMGIAEMGVDEMGGTVANTNPYGVIDPYTLTTDVEQMGLTEMGVGTMGGFYTVNPFEVVANNIDPLLDADFFTDTVISEMGDGGEMGEMEMNASVDYLDKLKFTFFVSGDSFPSDAIIAFDRKAEFRQLILKLKPANTVAFVYAEYSKDDFNNDFNNDFTNFIL